MTVYTTSYNNLGLKLTLDEVFDVSFNEEGWQYEDVYEMRETEDAYEDDVQIQMPDAVDIVSEGGSYTRVDIEYASTTHYQVFTLKTEMKITKEAEEDLKYQPMRDGAKALGTALHRTIERLAAANIYNGFSSQLAVVDGLSIFNTAHACKNPLGSHPTTYSNRSQGKLNAVNLKNRRIAGRKQLDEHGSPTPCKFNQLIVPPDLEYDAQMLVESQLEPFTANNQKNVVGRGLKVYVLDYLQEAPNYASGMWILRDSAKAKNKCFKRLAPESEIDREEKTGDKLYRVRTRLVFGWSDPRGVDGNTGEL